MANPEKKREGGIETEDERPPVFNSWKGWYWLLMIVLGAQIILYLIITRSFA